MTILALRDLTIRVAGRALLDGASLQIDAGHKVGLVGKNGAGKSTLLKAITGELQVDGGEIHFSARARMGHVAQEAASGPDSILQVVLSADTERASLLVEADTAEGIRLGEVHDRLIAIRAESAPARAAIVLAGLGFDAAAQARKISEFSGGWRMRVALAQVLFLEPDLLLLDEPTNHLDLEAALWLEGWIAKFSGAVILVSHDRGLLDRAVDSIAHLDQRKITLYTGGFERFVRVRAERFAQSLASNAKLTAERDRIQGFVDRFRAKASKARQAQSRLKALERMPPIEAVVEDTVTRFAFPEPEVLPPPILQLNHAAAGYGDKPILSKMNLRIDPDDRIALLGANGNGKSTLAKLLAGRLAPMAGEVARSTRLRVGYFAQHQTEALDLNGTPLTHMQAALPKATETQCRAQLARFGLDADRATNRVGACSGGEKGRLLLALATRDAPQLLILDEPTNHLDIDAREALVKALSDYSGAVLLITHDPHLVELIAERLWLVADGTVVPFEGDLDDYRVLLSQRARGGREEGAAPAGHKKRAAEDRAAQAVLKGRIKEVEAAMAKYAKELSLLEAKLGDAATYARFKPKDIAWANTRRAAIAHQTQILEAQWLELSEKLETAAAA
jgi:ATP-binding cassette subfamily F protein 3